MSLSGMGEPLGLEAKPSVGLPYDGGLSGWPTAAHTTHSLHYHFVFIPKHRRLVLRGEVAKGLPEVGRANCSTHHIEIMKGPIRPERVRLRFGVLPYLVPSRVMQAHLFPYSAQT